MERIPKFVEKVAERLEKQLSRRVIPKQQGGRWYAYTITSKRVKTKRYPQKRFVYIGKITEQGEFVPKKSKRVKVKREVFEYGTSRVVSDILSPIIPYVQQQFPGWYKEIISLTIVWSLQAVPLKRVASAWEKLYDSCTWNVNLSEKVLSTMLKEIGKSVSGRFKVFASLIREDSCIVYDLTHIFTESEQLRLAEHSYNPDRIYMLQIHLGVAVDVKNKKVVGINPTFGSVREIQSIEEWKKGLKVKNIIWIGDRGFASLKWAKKLDEENQQFIIPLRKNFGIVDYSIQMIGVFKYKERPIRYGKKMIDKNTFLYLYEDPMLRGQQETLLLNRLLDKKITDEKYKEKQIECGRIGILSNLNYTAESIYQWYKHREEVELLIDGLKNILRKNTTHINDEDGIRGFYFIATLCLYVYYEILNKIRENKKTNKISVSDLIFELSKVYMLRDEEKTYLASIPKKTRKCLESMGLEYVLV